MYYVYITITGGPPYQDGPYDAAIRPQKRTTNH